MRTSVGNREFIGDLQWSCLGRTVASGEGNWSVLKRNWSVLSWPQLPACLWGEWELIRWKETGCKINDSEECLDAEGPPQLKKIG